MNLTALGTQCTLIGSIGDDVAGQKLKQLLSYPNLRTCLFTGQGVTTKKSRILAANKHLLRYDQETPQPIDTQTEASILKEIQGTTHIDLVIVSDYAKGTLTKPILKALISKYTVIVDPKPPHAAWYENAFLITPNLKEAKLMSGLDIQDETALTEAGNLLKKRYNSHILITRGPQGMSLFQKGSDTPFHLPTQSQEVFDVTGAGDTVVAQMALGIASKWGLRASMMLANAAAGFSINRLGATTLSPEEFRKLPILQKENQALFSPNLEIQSTPPN